MAMSRIPLTLAATAVATAAGLASVLGPAGTASADQSPEQTISQLESQGYTVNIDRVGSGSKCVVTSVRNPNTNSYWIREGSHPSVLVPVIISRTVQVSLYCA